jgi:DNA polymerase III sliding clamp (beta) subunit (PCNA family)
MTTVLENKSQTTGEGESVKIMGALLLELLEGVSSHAERDKSLPTLNAVELEGGGGLLIARATDRYRLIEGQARVLEGYLEGSLDKALISLDDTKRIITLLKDQKSSIMSVTRDDNSLTVSVLDNSVRVKVLGSTFPPTSELFAKSEGEPVAVEGVAFNPAYFTDYAKIAGKGAAVKVYFTGEGKPMRVRITSDTINWRALLMPMRYTD